MTEDGDRKELLGKLQAWLDEHFDCYIVIGYNERGERERINRWSSQMQCDALLTFMEEYRERYMAPKPVVAYDPPDDEETEGALDTGGLEQ